MVDSPKSAQERVNQIETFRRELDELERAGVIKFQLDDVRQYHDDLLADLKRQYDVDLNARSRELSLGMRIWSMLGALALTASVFFFFYQIWGYLNAPLQVTILISASVISLAGAFFINGREQATHFTNPAALIAFACFVLNISMLGRIFNTSPSDYVLLIFAAYGALIAYSFGLRLLLAFSILFFYGFVAARVGTWAGLYWISFGQRPENFLLPALLLFLVPAVFVHRKYADFIVIYRVFALTGLFLTLLVLSNWGQSSYIPLDPKLVEGGYQVAGFILAAGTIWLGLEMRWRDVVIMGNVGFVMFLYTKFFDWWWDWMPKSVFFLIVGATAILALIIFRRIRLTEAQT